MVLLGFILLFLLVILFLRLLGIVDVKLFKVLLPIILILGAWLAAFAGVGLYIHDLKQKNRNGHGFYKNHLYLTK